ncbi:ABC transporter substrate-binding protein [Streptomyces sp. NBC_00481]|uniref:glycine betaine ABC transporter substrate-binding protein n=1 Tax=unclassified Streptomyces TaxID=2593676 RepID=UPI002DDADC94|nr:MULTISPECIES: glycine betaine ABC transporter substrate-binding protein [unclassified Streptomyces]WRY98885.1 ABC transporter substrate-binding protein [Streptomyces sp. NBC_00481]
MIPGILSPLRIVALAVCSLFILSGCADGRVNGTYSGHADRPGPIVIGTDSSAESRVVAAIYRELLTASGQEVRTAGTTYASPAATAQAVVAGEISLAPAYESTMLRALPGGQTMPGNMEATLSMALPPGIVALPPAAAQRGIVLAVTEATAERHTLRSLADLGEAEGRLTLGGSASGDPGAASAASLKKAYGVTLTSAGTSGTADLLVLHSTDPAITRDGLVVLTDPESVIPPEHVFPLISAPAVDATGRAALARVNTPLTTGQLAALAASVEAGEAPGKAARTWLRSKGLLR